MGAISHCACRYRLAYNIDSDQLASNALFETEIMCAFTSRFANVTYASLRKELLEKVRTTECQV